MMQRNNKVVANSTKGLKQSYQHLGNLHPNQGIMRYLISFISKSFTALRASLHKRYTTGDRSPWSATWGRSIAWMPLAILLLVGLILLRKDFNLNINLTAPQGQNAPAGWSGNDLARPAHWTPDDNEQVRVVAFVRSHVAMAVEMKQVYGVPMSVQLAAALAATDGGQSDLIERQNNPFGVRCHAKDCPKGHCTHLENGEHKVFYRNYKQPEAGWKAFCTLITTGKYRDIKAKASTPAEWVAALDDKGYWTAAGTTAAEILRWIDKYQLTALDVE